MNDAPPNSTPPAFDIVQFARATRFALASVVFCISYLSLRSSLHIGHFEQIYHDMLGGKPLPSLTIFVVRYHLLFVLVSFAVPVIAFAMLFMSNIARSVHVVGWLVIITFIEFLVVYQGLSEPLLEIMKQMGGAQ
jgi:hypothetical protein